MITVKHCPYHSVLKPVPKEEKPACSWQLLPRWANASSQAPQPSASYFKNRDGGPSSELIIARKNKFQPYFPVSLIYKGFSIAICLLVFHWPAEVCQAQQGRKKGLSILQLSLLLLSYNFFPYATWNMLNLHALGIIFATYLFPLHGYSSICSEK